MKDDNRDTSVPVYTSRESVVKSAATRARGKQTKMRREGEVMSRGCERARRRVKTREEKHQGGECGVTGIHGGKSSERLRVVVAVDARGESLVDEVRRRGGGRGRERLTCVTIHGYLFQEVLDEVVNHGG